MPTCKVYLAGNKGQSKTTRRSCKQDTWIGVLLARHMGRRSKYAEKINTWTCKGRISMSSKFRQDGQEEKKTAHTSLPWNGGNDGRRGGCDRIRSLARKKVL